MNKTGGAARFEMTYCSQCGKELGAGNCGLSDCRDHHPLKCKAKGCRRKTKTQSGFCWQHWDMAPVIAEKARREAE